jgi:hypothetical protein
MPAKRKKLNVKALTQDLVQWFTFTVVMTVVPIFTALITTSLKSNRNPDFMSQVSLNGELLIASVAIAAEACSDMYKRSTSTNMKLLVGGTALVLVIIACSAGTSIQESKLSGKNINDFSLTYFGVCVLVGAGTKIMARS